MAAIRQDVPDYSGIKGLYNDDKSEKKGGFIRLEQLRKKRIRMKEEIKKEV